MSLPVVTGLLLDTEKPAAAIPPGFTEQVVFTGLTRPTKVVFSPDGRIFIAQKNGQIKVYDSTSDTTATIFADLRTNVYDYEDFGLIGLALPPNFPADPYVYVSYSYDGVIGGTAPRYNDTCSVTGNCMSSARVSRLQANGNVMTGTEQVLLHDWCQQIESHSIGELNFGPDGALYVTGGEGASATFTDYGQAGNPTNPCGDPPAPAGGPQTPPTSEGGALRSQDIRTSGDPTGLSGTLIRINPATGAAMPDNPLANSTDPNNRRILAHGLRNPTRWTFRPGTSDVWIGDVGWRTWEEINKIPNPAAGPLRNYGWPCYEGNATQGGYNSANLTLCESLYSAPAGTVTPPYYTYAHSQVVAAGDGCPTGGSAPSGVAFYPATGGNYPASYAGALFFADYSRECIWAMRAGANGEPDPASIIPFSSTVSGPVDLEVGPDQDLYYVDLTGGTVRRFHYSSGNQPPAAAINATPVSGNAPLRVNFDASGSTDSDPGDILSYQWDFTNDGTVDSTATRTSFTYTSTGTYTARLRVSDIGGASDTKTIQIRVGTNAPEPVIDTPLSSFNWQVGQTVNFSGHASDPQEGNLGPGALHWELINRHCYAADNCHTHPVQNLTGVASGSFVAPDHEFPSYLELTLTATDSGGLSGSTTVRLDPRTVNLNLASSPSGLTLNVNGADVTTPATRQVIVGSTNTVSAPTPQAVGASTFDFDRWSDGGARTHVVTAPATDTTYTATYTADYGDGDCGDTFGYTCTTATGRAFVPVDGAVLPLTGDEAVTQVTFPFPIPFYGQSYTSAWVDVNGKISFTDPGPSPRGINSPIPEPGVPNAAIYPFWDDLFARADSTVRTGVVGTAPNRQFVVEWRNSGMYGSSSARVTFEALISETGQITFNYADLAASKPAELGGGATVGIENAAGTVAVQYGINQPLLANGKAVIFTPPNGGPPPEPEPPTTGTVTGTVTRAAGGTAVSGATVTLSPGGRSTTTAANGSYTLTGVAPGTYSVAGTATGDLTGSGSVTVVAGSTHTVNLSLAAPPEEPPPTGDGDYTKSTETRPFVPAEGALLPLTGDDAVGEVTLPFAFPFYGQTYNSAWVSSNGFLSFVNPSGAQPVNTAVPDAAPPNGAVYPFWDDLVIRADSTIRTAAIGTGADRRFVVEWRNIGMYGSSSARITAEAILSVNGEIAFHYADLATTKPTELGGGATVGIENPAGTAAVQHSYNQPILVNGTAIVFRPE
ncbi:PQQ-dependent sugar dehydrogenase [Micromonospora sp. NBC_01796]|uniref:PQQ-dependent sugar dehydrogenase n=1 Tax=Micromonospora sp. NBC_01796 TaxID=2975987 RepID=UPI002DD9A436|nr:PQQ-dependent sugar dehydrogenase [Micromonospora sp. NBC_01796]WSA89590.1 PQQ-dependent sugar dehydrogenase [Micromonospora sp. NBC_01796]